MRRRLLAAVGAAAVLLAACPQDPAQRGPDAPDDGIQLTGDLGGHRVHVSDGEPEVVVGDCDPNDGLDEDVCITTFTIDGAPLTLVIENPAALGSGLQLPVAAPGDHDCLPHCDDVTGAVVVEVRQGTLRTFGRFGTVEVREAGPRYAASFTLEVQEGDVAGRFNVRQPTVAAG